MSSRFLRWTAGLVTLLAAGSALACPGALNSADKTQGKSATTASAPADVQRN